MPSFIWIYVILNHIWSLFCHTKSEYIIWSLLRPYHKINTANESYELVLRSLYNSHGTGNGKHLRKHLLPLKKVSHMCLKQHEWRILIFGWTTPLTLVTMQKNSSVLFRQDHLFLFTADSNGSDTLLSRSNPEPKESILLLMIATVHKNIDKRAVEPRRSLLVKTKPS